MKPLFEEKQRYTQWWLWLILVSAATLVIGVFIQGIYVQLILGTPWGDRPLSDEMLLINAMVAISIMFLMLILFFSTVMETVVERGGVSYRYFPLVRNWRRIEREAIQSFEIKTSYSGSHGIRRDFHGNRTVNVKGLNGIEITMHDGKRLLLGTQKPGEFLDALNKMKKGSFD